MTTSSAKPTASPSELELMESLLPEPGKLIALAEWFDVDDAAKGRSGHDEVQRDLRKWAVDIDKLRKQLKAMRRACPRLGEGEVVILAKLIARKMAHQLSEWETAVMEDAEEIARAIDSEIMEMIRAELGAALVQVIPNDDAIIIEHVRKAYAAAGGRHALAGDAPGGEKEKTDGE